MKRRNGFTLIELLVVIGIIMVLVAMLTFGYRSLNKAAAGRETHAELKVCKGMLAEYEGRNGLVGIEWIRPADPLQPAQSVDPGATGPGMFPVYVDPASQMGGANLSLVKPGAVGSYWPSLQLADVETSGANGILADMGDKSTDPNAPSPRYFCNAVPATLDALYVLSRIPANATLLSNHTAKRQLEMPSGKTPFADGSGHAVNSANAPVPYVPAILDGWGNPIIFVPRAGMHVNILRPNAGGQMVPTLSVVRSTGTFDATVADPPLTGNERPFFASAGQDGDFTQGDDNVYSFQE